MNIKEEALKNFKNIIDNYENNEVQVVEGLYYNQYQTLRKIEFYWNSKYINGQKDEIGRIKPFYNITKFRVNVATRATDLDVKDIKCTSDNPDDRARTIIFNKELYNWMKEANLSYTLNVWGKTRAKYGGVLTKTTKKDGKINTDVVQWKNVIADPVNIKDGVVIEKHYMSPSELSKKKGVWENVEDAMKLATKSRTDKNKTEATEYKIPVYEIHGEFPETYIPDIVNPDETEYKKCLFFIAGNNMDVPLYYEEEDESPYDYLAWDDVFGRGLGIGVVEDGFESQMWTNDAIIAEKNILDLAGKVYIKTNSDKFSNNILTDTDTGQVFNLNENEDANVLNLMPNSLPQFQNLVEKWNTQYERSTNTFDAVTGETLPSNTPLGSVAIQTQQASSFFDYRREEAGIFWRNYLNKRIIPDLIKRINKSHLLASDYSAEELDYIDNAFTTYKANEKAKELILSGKVPTQEEYNQFRDSIKDMLAIDGTRRYLDIPEGYFKDFEAKITIDPTGESKNKQEQLTSLWNILTQASNPTIRQDPEMLKILSQILEIAGIKFYPKPLAIQAQPTPSKQVKNPQTALESQTKSLLPEAQQ